jgi:hypothetical protein
MQFPAPHSKIPLHDLRASDSGVNHQCQIHLSVPLLVCLGNFMWMNLHIWHRNGGLNSREHEIPELAAFAVKDPHMPAQSTINECVRDDLTVRRSPFQRVVFHTEYLMLVNGPSYHREFRQHGAVQMQGKLARQIAATLTIVTVPESPGDCRKHTLGFVLKDGREALTRYVNLPATIKIDVPRRKFPIGREIPCRHGRSDSESLHQVPPAGIAQKPEAEFDVG